MKCVYVCVCVPPGSYEVDHNAPVDHITPDYGQVVEFA